MTYDSREKSRYGAAPLLCFRFVQGGTLVLHTSADQDVVLPVGTFTTAAIKCGGSEHSQEDGSGSVELEVPLDHKVATMFVGGLPVAPIGLTIYRAHRTEESDYKAWFVGTVESAAYETDVARLTCLRSSEKVRRQFPRDRYQIKCNFSVYSPAECGINANSFRDPCVISSVAGDTIVSADFALRADGWYTAGWLEVPGGEKRTVKSHVTDTIVLLRPFRVAPEPGDTLHAFAGDDRTLATCKNKFNNLVNFRGFPYVPIRNPFDGKIT